MEKFFGICPTTDEKRLSWKIAVLYALIAGLWFFLSDQLLAILTREPEKTTWLHLLNDWLYVLVTAVLLWWLVWSQVRALRREDALLRSMAQGVSVAAGEAFFASLTRNLAETLEMDAALICEVRGVPPARLLLTGDGGRLPVTWQLRARLTPEGAPDYCIAIGTAACEAPQRDGMP